MISFKNSNLYIDSTEICSQINIEAPSKKLTTLIGANGTGKSSFLKALIKLPPFSLKGNLKLNNLDFLAFNINDLAQSFHYLAQNCDTSGFQGTVADYIQITELSLKNDRELFDIDKFRSSKLNSLSGGERQRLFLLAALSSRKYLLLDEPLGHLDPLGIKIAKERLSSHTPGGLIVSHDFEWALKQPECYFFKNKKLNPYSKETLIEVYK